MKQVKNEVFYHVQNLDHLGLKTPWKVGTKIQIGEELNPYSYVLEHGMSNHSDRQIWIEQNLGHFFKCTREAILEEVRLSEFAHLPSRRNCLWVIEDKQESIDFWWSHFKSVSRNRNDISLLKVSLTGSVFKTSQRYVGNSLITVNEIRKQAHEYWEAKETVIDHEVLFCGTLEVLSKEK